MRRHLLDARVRYGAALAWAVYVLAASLVEPPAATLSLEGPFGVPLDKWLHALTYATLAALVAYALLARDAATVAAAAVVAAAYGLGVEAVQAAVPVRSFDLLDAAANAVGAWVAGAAWWVAARLLGRRPAAEV